ncbi:MAG: hypothetical protein PHU80_12070, partial [Kiritimatiellae bacterium]|nr:hypothetical protein [Kiritimatiellia bacterium]
LGGIAEQESITVSADDTDRELAKMAQNLRMKPEQLRADLEKNERFDEFRDRIRDDKTLRFIMDALKH